MNASPYTATQYGSIKLPVESLTFDTSYTKACMM